MQTGIARIEEESRRSGREVRKLAARMSAYLDEWISSSLWTTPEDEIPPLLATVLRRSVALSGIG